MEAIDLGLSVKWADKNLDANSPTDAGGRYAWAELSSKVKYTWENLLGWICSGRFGPFYVFHFR